VSPRTKPSLILVEQIEPRILVIRGQRVILDADLAELYGTTTKVLNQAVKRNLSRFPADFMFQLTSEEAQARWSQLVTTSESPQPMRSQIVTASEPSKLMWSQIATTSRRNHRQPAVCLIPNPQSLIPLS
jgi:hypothetical protein